MSVARITFAPNVIISSDAPTAYGCGIQISTNVYIVGFSSATRYFGDGSQLTGITATVPPAISVSTINATATTPYGGVNITTNVFMSGRVAISRTIPITAKFQVTATNNHLVIDDSDGATDEKLWLFKANDSNLEIVAANDAWNSWTGAMGIKRTGTTINRVWFPNGNVGIGTNNPGDKLEIAGGKILLDYDGAGTGNPAWELKVSSTSATPAGYYATYAP